MEPAWACSIAPSDHDRKKPRQNLIEKITPMSEVDWQARYETADTPWDKGVPHPMISHWTKTHDIAGAIVVPGCGRGWDLRAWAMAFPQHSVIGIDLAPAAVASARENCADLPNVRVIESDFFDLSAWHDGQDLGLIWEHTCFCAIPPHLRDAYVRSVSSVLPTGAWLIGAFFTDITDRDSGPPWNTQVEEIIERLSPHFTIEFPALPHQTFPGREGEERSIVMRRM
jgi:methyl halide transferase